MSVELLMIAGIVMMVFESGFWDDADDWVNRKLPFHHLPKPFICQFCQTFWLSLLYLIVFTPYSLILSLFWALINANIGEVLRPLFKLVKSALYGLIELLGNKIY